MRDTLQDTIFEYELENNVLHVNGTEVKPYGLEDNDIGTCNACGSNLKTLSYHSFKDDILVVTKCTSCKRFTLIIYNKDWNWINEVIISQFLEHETSDDLLFLNSLSQKQLQTIFSPTEITAMFNRAKRKKCVRQYLYNARKKYQVFEDVFGIKISI